MSQRGDSFFLFKEHLEIIVIVIIKKIALNL